MITRVLQSYIFLPHPSVRPLYTSSLYPLTGFYAELMDLLLEEGVPGDEVRIRQVDCYNLARYGGVLNCSSWNIFPVG